MSIHNIMYIERCAPNHSGEAHIGEISCSKAKKTIYYKSKVLQKLPGVRGNYQDLKTGEEYWVSGVKKVGTNRHWAATGFTKVIIDKEAKEEFLLIVNGKLPSNYEFEV